MCLGNVKPVFNIFNGRDYGRGREARATGLSHVHRSEASTLVSMWIMSLKAWSRAIPGLGPSLQTTSVAVGETCIQQHHEHNVRTSHIIMLSSTATAR